MLLADISTGNKIGLSLVAAAFVVFSLLVSMVVPRFRPDFPGSGGMRLFVIVTLVFFVGTLAAVEGFAKEEPEGAQTHQVETGSGGQSGAETTTTTGG